MLSLCRTLRHCRIGSRLPFAAFRWTTSSALPASTQQSSLAWVQLHEESPVSIGINTWGGYLEMIPSKARLPFKQSLALENALDYVDYGSVIVCYRVSILHRPVELVDVELKGIRVGKKGTSRMKATMEVGNNLVGTFSMRDTFTQSALSVVFDAGVGFRALKSSGLVMKN